LTRSAAGSEGAPEFEDTAVKKKKLKTHEKRGRETGWTFLDFNLDLTAGWVRRKRIDGEIQWPVV